MHLEEAIATLMTSEGEEFWSLTQFYQLKDLYKLDTSLKEFKGAAAKFL